jgi:hypothetical protein
MILLLEQDIVVSILRRCPFAHDSLFTDLAACPLRQGESSAMLIDQPDGVPLRLPQSRTQNLKM